MADLNVRVVCVGAATQDVFLAGKALTAKRDVRTHNFVEQFPLGGKFDLDGIVFDTGGGAHNAAITFARQGLSVGFMGKVGHDPAGAEVVRVLAKEGVSVDRVVTDPKLSTGYSTLLLSPKGERVVLVYRGASHGLKASDFELKKLTADWFYISSLAGNLDLLSKIIKQAESCNAKVAYNPGGSEIAQARKLKKLLPKLEVLLTNREELELLYGGDNPKQTMANVVGVCPYVLMTDGPNGSYLAFNQRIYFAGQYQKVKVVDRTGAGDAFGSGFVAAIAKGEPVEDALTLASANSTAVVQTIGAKPGILKTGRLRRMKIRTIAL